MYSLTIHELHPSGCPLWSRISLIWARVAMALKIVMCKRQWFGRYGFECRCLLVVFVSFTETS